MTAHPLVSLCQRIGHPRILVLGDLILDRYTWGDAARISPEAPVPLLLADFEETRLGGGASVATLLRGLEAEVTLAGIVGDDGAGATLTTMLDDAGIRRDLVCVDPLRPTTIKERFVGRAAARHPHQILRVDRERCDPLSECVERRLIELVQAQLPQHQGLLISDYRKGVCTPALLALVIETARRLGLPIIVDPARIADYTRYQHATILKPNRHEAELATGRGIPTPNEALVAGHQLCRTCRVEAAIVTLDSQGMALSLADGSGELFVTRPRAVYDITGAGDMAMATIGIAQATGLPLKETVELANIAAGLEVERMGVTPVSRAEIQAELVRTSRQSPYKLVSLEEMAALAEPCRRAGRKVVFTNGCFDLLHAGHVGYLHEAAHLGDVLVVAVNSDASVRRLKTADRPVIGQAQRAALVAALACVDYVLIFEEDTPHELLRRIRPDVLVKGGTCTVEEVVGREIVQAYGGQVCVTGKMEGISTTAILEKVRLIMAK